MITTEKNASVLATPIPLAKVRADSKFFADLSASHPGKVSLTAKIGMSPSGPFYTPQIMASKICASFLGGATASRDYLPITANMMRIAPWVRFKAKENNASRTVVNFNLVISR